VLPPTARICTVELGFVSALVVAQIGDVAGGFDLELHAFGDDEELALAVALPFAAGQLGLERAGYDVHVLDAIGAEAVLAGFNHANRRGAVGGADGETLDFAFKIGIVFHARVLMPVFGAFDNTNQRPRRKTFSVVGTFDPLPPVRNAIGIFSGLCAPVK